VARRRASELTWDAAFCKWQEVLGFTKVNDDFVVFDDGEEVELSRMVAV
jgi:hypothetical protein